MNYKIFIFSACVILASLLPVFHVYERAGGQWKGIVPTFVDDDLYYYARMENVVHGYPLIGNPYFFEHRQDIGPTSFLPDWIAATPQFFKLSFVDTIVFNFIFWSLVFSLLLYILFRKLSVSENAALIGTFITYCFLYMLILRPVAMQIVYPFFILFCVAYYIWLDAEKPTIKQSGFLMLTIVISIYLYSYSWQLVLAVLGLTGLLYIYQKNWSKLKNLIGILCISFILAIPDIFYTIKQLQNPYFWNTMVRINLVTTRLPTFLSCYDTGIIGLILVVWYFCFLWLEELHNEKKYRTVYLFTFITGFALIVALFSNVITGKDFEVSNHFDRYVLLWLSVMLITIIYFLWKSRTEFFKIASYKKISLFVLLFLFFCIYGHLFSGAFGFSGIMNTDTVSVQVYADPLTWLNIHGEPQAVVWSDGGIGSYIPIQTNDFTLFEPNGGLHLVSPSEVEERYLVSNYFDNLTLTDIEEDFRQYAGVGNAVHVYKTYNRKVEICDILFSHFGAHCGTETDAVSFKGVAYFQDLYSEYTNETNPNIVAELKKFHVKYILKDNSVDPIFQPQNIPGTTLVWQNSRFEIYMLP